MKNYEVKVIYMYTDTVEVKAENKEDAKAYAVEIADEQCSHLHDVIVTEIN